MDLDDDRSPAEAVLCALPIASVFSSLPKVVYHWLLTAFPAFARGWDTVLLAAVWIFCMYVPQPQVRLSEARR